MKRLFDMRVTTGQRRGVLAVAIVAVLAIAYLNVLAERLDAEVEALFLAPVAVVAWVYPKRPAFLFALATSVAGVVSCAGRHNFPLAQTTFETAIHVGTFLSAAWVVGMLAESMARERREARYDGMTEIPNSVHFHEHVDRELARAKRYGHPVTVAFLDLDNFKRLNDEHGHLAGDQALNSIAGLIGSQLRGSDLVGRLGGDEFGILLPETNRTDSQRILERVRGGVAAMAEKNEWPIGASIGATTLCGDACDIGAQSAIQRADTLMYRIKESSKNGVLVEDFA